MSLHQQGANRGAVTSFLISTPESGVDSIAITYALLDPIMTVVRPVVAFLTAITAGIVANLKPLSETTPPASAQENFVEGAPQATGAHQKPVRSPQSYSAKVVPELKFAFTDFWGDLAGAFFIGVLLAGAIAALIPESFFTIYLGGGIGSMLVMLVAGIPLYICATASTPIAAALILKGVSPGAALVFLLAGPATNAAAVAVVLRTLGKRTTVIYLASIAGCALLFGLLVDLLYSGLGLSARAVAGSASEAIPHGLALACAIFLLLLTCFSLGRKFSRRAPGDTRLSSGSTPAVTILPNLEAAGRPPGGPS